MVAIAVVLMTLRQLAFWPPVVRIADSQGAKWLPTLDSLTLFFQSKRHRVRFSTASPQLSKLLPANSESVSEIL